MKIFLATLLIITASMSIGSKLDVNLKMGTLASSYGLPFENGYVLNKGDRLLLFLKFHKKNELLKRDTDERIHIYISGEKAAFNKVESLGKIKAFFVRVQARPDYGHLTIEKLQLIQVDSTESHISGLFKSDKVQPEREVDRSITLNIANLPLTKVNSFDEIDRQDKDYFKQIVQKEFHAEWSSN